MIQKETIFFNDGVVLLYTVTNTASPGAMPQEGLALAHSLRYHSRTVGLTRYFTALAAKIQVAKVLRCPKLAGVTTKHIAVPADGMQYRIVQIQYPEGLPVMDLTLEEIEPKYPVLPDGGEDDESE